METEKQNLFQKLGQHWTHYAWIFSVLGAIFGTHQFEATSRGEPGFFEQQTFSNLAQRIDSHDRRFDSIEDKLDRILDKLSQKTASKMDVRKETALKINLGPNGGT